MPARRRVLVAVGVASLVAAATGGVWLRGRQDGSPVATAPRPTGTAIVQRQDLAVTDQVNGTLGFDDQRSITVPRAGVVTMLAAAGSTVPAGKPLYAIDREPTIVLTGAQPAYRALDRGSSDGTDIRQLEQALVALGHGGDLTVDDNFTAATADAVRAWEDDLGRADPDGRVELGDLLFAAGPVRVVSHSVAPGAQVQVGAGVLLVASTTKVVAIDLDADWTDSVVLGDAVSLSLPDGQESSGKVTRIGAATQPDSSDAQATVTVPVTVRLTDQKAAAAFDSGTVEVTVVRSEQQGVLTVPVTALLALAEGGYAVQVVDPADASGYRLLGVTLGTVSDSVAAVSGDGVQAGLTVVVPA